MSVSVGYLPLLLDHALVFWPNYKLYLPWPLVLILLLTNIARRLLLVMLIINMPHYLGFISSNPTNHQLEGLPYIWWINWHFIYVVPCMESYDQEHWRLCNYCCHNHWSLSRSVLWKIPASVRDSGSGSLSQCTGYQNTLPPRATTLSGLRVSLIETAGVDLIKIPWTPAGGCNYLQLDW